MKLFVAAFVAVIAAFSATSEAQTIVDMKPAFTGRNIYSSSVIMHDGIYEQWYGGWQTQADYPNDHIFRRTSTDGVNWSAPQTVLTTTQVGNSFHVNDPSVTRHYNAQAGAWQYTMFFTNCKSNCSDLHQTEIWSAVSQDGIKWGSFRRVLANGASTPSVVIEQDGTGSFFSMYHSNVFDNGGLPKHVFKTRVDGAFNVLSTSTVYTYTRDNGVIANPEVRNIDGLWHLFFNVYHTVSGATHDTADIYLAKSTNNTSWATGSETGLIVNDPNGPFCHAMTPGVLPLSGGKFALWFAQTPYSPGTPSCSFGDNTSIQRWIFQN